MTTLAIVGARFRPPAQAILDNLSSGTKLLLRRQPDNPYDANAVQVLLPMECEPGNGFPDYGDTINSLIMSAECPTDEPLHLGFIPRGDAVGVAEWMDPNVDHDGMTVTWPCTLTFLPSGQPAVSFEEPNE